jgi:hypothetical protein
MMLFNFAYLSKATLFFTVVHFTLYNSSNCNLRILRVRVTPFNRSPCQHGVGICVNCFCFVFVSFFLLSSDISFCTPSPLSFSLLVFENEILEGDVR